MSAAPGTVVLMTDHSTSPILPVSPTIFAAHSPEDLLAAVPVVLGFEPESSLVMLTFGGQQQFHARIDLPDPGGVADCVETLLAPARHHGVARVVFLIYGDGVDLAGRLARRLMRDFRREGIEVVECLRASGGHWFLPLGASPTGGVAYDVAEHPFRAQGVLAGHVTEPSRAALAARLDPDPALQRAVTRALRRAVPPSVDRVGTLVDSLLDAPPTAEDIACLLLGISSLEGRDRAWSRMSREGAGAHVELWTAVLRGASGQMAAQPAALLAFASWLEGHGALAWCAVDRCLAAEPDHRLGRLVAEVLERAVAPSRWEPPEAA